MTDPLVYLLATVGALALLGSGALSVLALIGMWRQRRRDPEAELRLRRHAERKAAENGRPHSEGVVQRATRRRS